MCLVLINLELSMHRSGLVSDELFYDKATCCSLSQAAAHHRTHARSVSSADLLSSCIWTSTRKTQKMHSRWVCVCTWRSQKNCTAGSLLLILGCIWSQYVGLWILPPVLWQNRWPLWRLLNRVRSKRLAMNSHASETPMHLLSRCRRRLPLVLWQIFTRGGLMCQIWSGYVNNLNIWPLVLSNGHWSSSWNNVKQWERTENRMKKTSIGRHHLAPV